MTLIVTALCEDSIWQVSDRRLTKAGAVYDDAAIKSVLVRCADAVFVMGFTGMALTHGSWGDRLDEWMAKTIAEWPVGVMKAPELLERVQGDLTALTGAAPRTERADQRLMWVAAGFGPPGPFVARVTNYTDIHGRDLPEVREDFQLFWSLRNSKPMRRLDMLIVGATSAVRDLVPASIQRARKKLHRRKPRAVLDALVQITRRAAADPSSGHLISKHCLGVIIHRSGAAECFDYPATASRVVSAPHQVGPAMSAIGLTLDSPSANTVVLKGRFKFSGIGPPKGTKGTPG